MPTTKQIADSFRERLADVAERGKVIGQALGVRADMAATRRRLRNTYAELGEQMYQRLQSGECEGDHQLLSLKERIDGLKAEAGTHEGRLRDLMQSGFSKGGTADEAAST